MEHLVFVSGKEHTEIGVSPIIRKKMEKKGLINALVVRVIQQPNKNRKRKKEKKSQL